MSRSSQNKSRDQMNPDELQRVTQTVSKLSSKTQLQFSIFSNIINQSSTFDDLTSLLFILEDLQLVNYFGESSIRSTYFISPGLANALDVYGFLGGMLPTAYIALTTIILLVVLVPIVLYLTIYFSQSTSGRWHKLAVQILRVYALAYPHIAFTPIVFMLAYAFKCPSVTRGPTMQLTSCADRSYTLVISAITLYIYVVTCFCYMYFVTDRNPSRKYFLSMATNKVSLYYMLIKLILVFTWIFLPLELGLLRVSVVCLAGIIMFLMHNHYYPFYDVFFTKIRCAVYMGVFLCGLVGMAGAAAVTTFSSTYAMTGAMFFSLVIGWIFGYRYTGKLYNDKQNAIRNRVQELAKTDYDDMQWKQTEPLKKIFRWASDVEFAARFSTNHLYKRRRPSEAHFPEIVRIFQRGILEYPDDKQIVIDYTMYLLHILGERQMAYEMIKTLPIQECLYLHQFHINEVLQVEMEEIEMASIKSYVKLDDLHRREYSRIIYETKYNHFKCLKYRTDFWSLLSTSTVMDHKFYSAFERMCVEYEKAAADCESGYFKLIIKFPDSFVLMDMCARFHMSVFYDIAFAQQLHQQSDYIKRMRKENDNSLSVISLLKNNTASLKGSTHFKQGDGRRRGSSLSLFNGFSADEGIQQKDKTRIRAKLAKRTLAQTQILGYIGIAAMIYFATVIAILFDTSKPNASTLEYVMHARERDEAVSMSVRRLRTLQTSALANDLVTFKATQSDLLSEMTSLEASAWVTFNIATGLSSDLKGLFTEENYTKNISIYPSINQPRIETKTNFLEYILTFADSGRVLATSNPSLFLSASTNNDFRNIVNNWLAEKPFTRSSDAFFGLKNFAEEGYRAYDEPIAFFIGSILFYFVFRFFFNLTRGHQKDIFQAFFELRQDVKTMRHAEAQQELQTQKVCSEIAAKSFLEKLNKQQLRKTWDIETSYLVKRFISFVVLISFSFAASQVSHDDKSYNQSIHALIKYCTKTRVETAVTVTLLNEIVRNDVLTWPSTSELVSVTKSHYDTLATYYQYLLSGKTSWVPFHKLSQYAPSFFLPANHICLPYNITVCETRVYNSSIGYTQELMSSGIMVLQDTAMRTLGSIVNGLSNSNTNINDTQLQLLNKILDPDLTQGWDRIIDYLVKLEQDNIAASEMRSVLFLTAYGVLIVLGHLVVIVPTLRYLLHVDHCSTEAIIRLPGTVRHDPQFASKINAIAKKTQGPSLLARFLKLFDDPMEYLPKTQGAAVFQRNYTFRERINNFVENTKTGKFWFNPEDNEDDPKDAVIVIQKDTKGEVVKFMEKLKRQSEDGDPEDMPKRNKGKKAMDIFDSDDQHLFEEIQLEQTKEKEVVQEEKKNEWQHVLLKQSIESKKSYTDMRRIEHRQVVKHGTANSLSGSVFVLGAFVGHAAKTIGYSLFKVAAYGTSRPSWGYTTDLGINIIRSYLTFNFAKLSHVRATLSLVQAPAPTGTTTSTISFQYYRDRILKYERLGEAHWSKTAYAQFAIPREDGPANISNLITLDGMWVMPWDDITSGGHWKPLKKEHSLVRLHAMNNSARKVILHTHGGAYILGIWIDDSGDSAGGGLSMALLNYLNIYLRDQDGKLQIPFPKCAVLYSPWVDLACSAQSYIENKEYDILPFKTANLHSPITKSVQHPVYSYCFGENMDRTWDLRTPVLEQAPLLPLRAIKSEVRIETYKDKIERFVRHPLVSPIYGDLEQLPPILIVLCLKLASGGL
ncbi:hypothetical protein EDD86DRAFT_271184 [Gorgonomyces haynaldii]|nr:hypothetical protein EDD86DRAFT_271184 [Gorgonomyces haynaldii]